MMGFEPAIIQIFRYQLFFKILFLRRSSDVQGSILNKDKNFILVIL